MYTKIMEISTDYIRGFADADGGFASHFIHLTNTDIDLLKRIGHTLTALGIHYHITYFQPKGHKKYGRLNITGLKNLLLFAKYIGFNIESKRVRLEDRIKHLCRKGRAYNPEDYALYVKMKAEGATYRAMAEALGLSSSTIDRREKRNLYPLDEQLLLLIKQFVN